jgi:hypothetical protein
MIQRWSVSPPSTLRYPPEARRIRHVDRDDGRDRRRVDEQALQDDLDVHQAIPDDRRRKRERDEAERNRREAHRDRRIDSEAERNRIAERERQAPSAVPQTIHRSWRLTVTERARESARSSTARPAVKNDAR